MVLDKKALEHLAKLARLELHKHEEEKMLRDLEKILEYFNELKEVNTDAVAPLPGGTELKNIFRDDTLSVDAIPNEKSLEQFPHAAEGFLKIPPVFE
jgi:aspartyl-tRNA(Asn)/glutamyl-tRNA(Gln) amidotransferase subunit C